MKYVIGRYMDTGDILRRGFGLLCCRLALFYTIMLIVELPILALRLALPNLTNTIAENLLIIPTFVLLSIGTGAIIRVVMQELLDRPISFGPALRFALSRFWPLLGTSFLSGLLICLGTLACIIPGIYLSI